ncbi:MAG: hypothetical protein ABI723_07390 [Bacteroidia bacterium]
MPLKKILRKLFIVLTVIAVLIFGAQLLLTHYLNSKIKSDIEDEVIKQSDGNYHLSIKKVKVNLFTRSIIITGIQLIPDKEKRDLFEPVYYLSATELNFSGFDLIPLIKNRELMIDKMKLSNLAAGIYRAEKFRNSDENKSTKQITLYGLIKKQLQLLSIKTIEISNADIKIYDHVTDTKPSLNSNDNNITVIDFKIDKTADEHKRFFLARKFEVIINNFSYITNDSLYALQVEKVTASYTDSLLCLDEVKLIPNYSKNQFGDAAGKQTDRLKISVSKTCFNQIDVKLFFERGWMVAKLLELDSVSINAYRDKNDERSKKRVKSVQQMIKAIPFFIAIDTLKLNNGNVFYEELSKGSTKSGKIFLHILNADISGLNNDSMMNEHEGKLILKATALIMGKGKLEAQYTFPLNTDKTIFDCSGRLSRFQLKELNGITENSANVSIKNGEIESMTFSFHANDVFAKGKMKLIYHDLKIEVLNKDHEKTGLLEKVETALAHALIIKENNPSGKEPIREAEIFYSRDPNRFIFNYSIKSLLSGIKSTLGLKVNSKK